MSTKSPTSPSRDTSRTWSWLSLLVGRLNFLLVVVTIGVIAWLAQPLFKAATKPEPPVMPSTMETVDWHDPDSSKYCLACHEQVGRAAGGQAVRRGHSQNVVLSEAQIAAVREMGTVVGPGNTLICMSCHKLGLPGETQFMLADTLEDSALCQHCHEGHYARGTPHDLRVSAPDETNRFGQTVAEFGPCSACHLAHSFAREIVRSELDPEGYCISCHSETHVAEGHARAVMEHPESRCRECHDPHETGHGDFLTAEVDDLCVRCHDGFGGGRARGMHPVGEMSMAVPAVLREAGAATLGHEQELTCVICHDTHEAPYQPLLRMTPQSNQLCMVCHEDKLLAQTHDGVLPRHGQQPKMSAEQQAVVGGWGNPVGPEGELLCVSCHGVHSAVPDTPMLSFQPKYSETCSACHPQHEGVVGSPHDLRINHPDERNAAGLLPTEAGVCSACHMAHQFPQERVSTAGDPGGQCIACHREGACGQNKLTGGADHPNTICIDCHDPHVRTYGSFLKAPAEQLCLQCHGEMETLIGGPHDPGTKSARWPAEAVAAGGPCLACHVPHGGAANDLFRFGSAVDVGNHDTVCTTCHADAAWDADSPIAAIHPQKIAEVHADVNLALVPTDVHGDKRLGCRTCHDPHGGAIPVHLARVAAEEETTDLCLTCHTDKQLIRFTGHSPQSLADAGYTNDSCKPCHAMHAERDDTYGQLLSPRFLMEVCEVEPDAAGGCVPCQACHTATGHAPTRTFDEHPQVVTMNAFAADDAGYLPLFGPDGHVDPRGQITCRTCHISHGRSDLLALLAQEATLSENEQHAVKAQLRPFEMPNVCSTCHGDGARVLFLHFHEPTRRPAPTRARPGAVQPGR